MTPAWPTLFRRLLIFACLALAGWAIVVAVTGGVGWTWHGWRFSSREPIRPALFAALAAAVCLVLSPRALVTRDLAALWQIVERRAGLVAVVLAGLTCWAGFQWGTFVAGGSDPYGYVSQAHLWLDGQLRVQEPLGRQMPWPGSERSFVPLGYKLATVPDAIVPTYPAGLPILMAAAVLAAGSCGPYFVVPALGALSVWLAYVLGRKLSARIAGLLAALLLSSSPAFVFQLMWPMSDVPATACWAASFALAWRLGSLSALGSGIAASAAILIRPNLAPIAIVVAAGIAWSLFRTGRPTWRTSRPAVLFAVGLAPGIAAVAVLQSYLWGSPLATGYGPAETLYAWSNVVPNLSRHTQWLLDTQTPAVLLALAGPVILGRRVADPRLRAVVLSTGLGVPAVVLLSYLFYGVFDEWWYLRFLLPAFPILFLLMATAWVAVLERLPVLVRMPLLSLTAVALVSHGWHEASVRGVFDLRDHESRYVDVGHYVKTALPPNAIFLTLQQSGSIRFYADRPTLSYPTLPPDWLDGAVVALKERNLHPYILLEGWEEPDFVRRFGEDNAFGKLDWTPSAERSGPVPVRLYDPDQRGVRRLTVDVIPRRGRGQCRERPGSR